MSSELAFLFPGQGSQSRGMLREFLDTEQVVADTFTEASDVLGYDMHELTRDNPNEKLNQTEYTQPALLTASTALLRLWEQRDGTQAKHAAGHSLGEYSALVAAGSLSFSDALVLVAFRGHVMTEAVPEGMGRMAVILGLENDQVKSLCHEISTDVEKVWPANYNCPGQLVVAGHTAAVNCIMERAKDAGARRAIPLQVSAPSHTPLMQPAADAMRKRLKDVEIKTPKMPVWSNALASPLEKPGEIEAALVQQLVSPVRWTETICHITRMGVCRGVEMGPGKVLSGIVRRIDRCFTVCPVDTPDNLAGALEQMVGTNGRR
ncbi:MAG: ACP S-malonyltransferase [Zetaproteobacteria bacterium]|nr:MAG: ACP S-malonyltransferase [Zetaproteobacteria bacterium]